MSVARPEHGPPASKAGAIDGAFGRWRCRAVVSSCPLRAGPPFGAYSLHTSARRRLGSGFSGGPIYAHSNAILDSLVASHT